MEITGQPGEGNRKKKEDLWGTKREEKEGRDAQRYLTIDSLGE